MSGGGVLPNGSVTQSDREYVDTWRSFSGPILDIIAPLGFRRYGFDPGVLFSRVSGEMLNLPTDVIAAINAKIAALQARLAAAEGERDEARGLLVQARPYVRGSSFVSANGDIVQPDEIRARIDAHLTPAPTKPVRCWDRDLCCGDDLCKFKNGETLPPNTYCAHNDKPEGGEGAR